MVEDKNLGVGEKVVENNLKSCVKRSRSHRLGR